MTLETPSKVNLGALWVFLGYLCSSTTGLTQALAPEEATSLAVGGLRMLTGGLFLLLVGILTKKTPNFKTIPKKPLILATLSLVGFQLTFFAACRLVGVAVGTVVAVGLSPIVVGIFAWLLLKERPTKIWYIATSVMLIGLIALGFSGANAQYSFDPLGVLLVIFAGFCYGLFVVLIKPALDTNGSLEIMTVVLLLGGLLLLPIVLSQPLGWVFTWHGIGVILNLGLVTAAMAFFLILYGMRTTPANITGALAITEPFCAALWGILILGEQIAQVGYMGLGLIFISSLVLILPSRKTQ